jgi:hypothetical protein
MDIGNIIPQENNSIEPMVEVPMVSASEFASDINDVLIAQESPSSGRVQSMMPSIDPTPVRRKTKNIFNLTDEQIHAIIAGIVGTLVFHPMVQGKLPVVNGAIQKILMNILIIAIAYFFAVRAYRNKFK